MTDQLRFHSIAELRELSIDELRALWELVPTERQRTYKAAYEREVGTAGASGSDALEAEVNAELLRRYAEVALVPVGARWARTPSRVQAAAGQDERLTMPEGEAVKGGGKPSLMIAAGLGLLAVVMIGFLFIRLFGGGANAGSAEATAEASYTPTPRVSPTPTPLALEEQDEIIEGGDAARAVAYPVNLQVITGDGRDPRVWVVQRRAVAASEWNFDPNPDTASFINGMSVSPVIGVPWSEDNAAFFGRIEDGTEFLLTMNTGAILRYRFEGRREVRRSESNIFRQVSPGLVLLLIGETDSEGLPTATRTLITAVYPPEQELSRDGLMLGSGVAISEGQVGEALVLLDTSITLNEVRTVAGQGELPPEQQYLLLDFAVDVGVESVDTTGWRVEFIDTGGQVYSPNTVALNSANFPPLPTRLEALSQFAASVGYVVPMTLNGGRWLVTDADGNGIAFTVRLPSVEPPPVAFTGIDVRVVSVTTIDGQLTTVLRIYNGQTETLHLTQDDIWLALGFAPNPPGPRNPAEGLTPFDLLPEQAVDLTLVWYWRGEPYATLGVREYRFAIEF